MIDRSALGRQFEPRTADVERGLLRLFLESIGEDNPVYHDDAAAVAAGYRATTVPPTYVMSLKIGVLHPLESLTLLGADLDLGRIFHGEQDFTYHAPVCVGDRITFVEKLVDIYQKKGGVLTFYVTETVATNQHGVHVADIRMTTVSTSEAPS